MTERKRGWPGPVEDPAERRRRALDTALRRADMTPTDAARAAGFSANTLFNFRNGLSASLSQKTLEKLAQVIPGASLASLSGVRMDDESRMMQVMVRCHARLGDWRENFDWPVKNHYEAPVQLPAADIDAGAFGVELRHPGADQIYPAGATLIVMPAQVSIGDMADGRRVLLQRFCDDRMEVSVREIVVDGAKAWLMPRTDNPRLQIASSMSWPPTGRMWRERDIRHVLAGLVTMSLCTEAANSKSPQART